MISKFHKENKIISIIMGASESGRKGFKNAKVCDIRMAGGEAGSESVVTSGKTLFNLSPEDVRALKAGEKWLEFDIEVIDCSKPTYNKFWYKKPVMEAAMQDTLFLRRMNNGGLASEANHPVDRSDLDRKSVV